MTTTLEHLKPHSICPCAKMLDSLPIAPSMQAIIIDRVAIVYPQLTPIIGVNAESVMACPENPQAACPTHSKVIALFETAPFFTCVAIVHILVRLRLCSM